MRMRRHPDFRSAAARTIMTKTALAIRHVHFEDLGAYAAPIEAAGYRIAYLDAGLDDLDAVDALAPGLLVVLGGPIGAYQEAVYPCLRDELRILARRLAADMPTLGVCLGAQLIARVLGARVAPGPRPEIGWARMALTGPGRDGPLRFLADTPVLHWHGDEACLPAGAECLARTEICANQAFAYGRNALALQFHAEVSATAFERWLIGHAHEIATASDLSVERLRAVAGYCADQATEAGARCISAWLARLDG
jgi:GMP synthase (glutamine-hydrolysing)